VISYVRCRNVNFHATPQRRNADFHATPLRGNADFHATPLRGNADFHATPLRRNADFHATSQRLLPFFHATTFETSALHFGIAWFGGEKPVFVFGKIAHRVLFWGEDFRLFWFLWFLVWG
jgi:hypothetical protein